MDVEVVEEWLDRLYIAAEGAGLRKEDRKKAREVAALLDEVARTPARLVVDAAAGKAYTGLLAARLVLRAPARVVTLERDEERVRASREAAARLELPDGVTVDVRAGDVSDRALWPEAPDLVVALHACGPAADSILDAAVAANASRLLLVPCCTRQSDHATALAERLGIPRHAQVRRAFVESIVAAERTLRLEAAGWQTEVVAFVPPTVTPYNSLWRARRVGEPGRMAAAAARRRTLLM